MSHILLTGFTPFDGRARNASWIAAQSLTLQHRHGHVLHCLRIPVCWGAASAAIPEAVARWRPSLIIAMGEGTTGHFRIETLARNQRKPRTDNLGQLPPQDCILASGPEQITSSAPCEPLRDYLAKEGIPAVLSDDAGGFLCEETLYALELCRQRDPRVLMAVFVHLPPYGTSLHYRGEERICDEALLGDFAQRLLTGALTLS